MILEFTPEEWAAHNKSGIIPVGGGINGKCVCAEPGDRYVFVCRTDDPGGKACGRYCCACFGNGDDNLCSRCWFALNGEAIVRSHVHPLYVRLALMALYPFERAAWCLLWVIGMIGAAALAGCNWLDRRGRK